MSKPESFEDYFIEIYEEEVESILKAIGHPEAFVTDESAISDFFPMSFDDEYREEIEKEENRILSKVKELFKGSGVDVCVYPHSKISELAVKLHFVNTGLKIH